MRVDLTLHLHAPDKITSGAAGNAVWVDVTDVHGESVPIFSRTPEGFEALAEAAANCARMMRGARARQFDLEGELERAG